MMAITIPARSIFREFLWGGGGGGAVELVVNVFIFKNLKNNLKNATVYHFVVGWINLSEYALLTDVFAV